MTTTITIDGQDLAYDLRPGDGLYDFQVAGATYCFRQWTWGEKNCVVDASTTLDPDTGQLRIDVAAFNELMLATSLVRSDAIAPITPEALRGLNPLLGDTLLAIAYWVNEVPVDDKKRSGAGAARGATTPGPDDLQTVPGVRLDSRPGAGSDGQRHRQVRADSQRARTPVGSGAR
jgi:hypothetical protein